VRKTHARAELLPIEFTRDDGSPQVDILKRQNAILLTDNLFAEAFWALQQELEYCCSTNPVFGVCLVDVRKSLEGTVVLESSNDDGHEVTKLVSRDAMQRGEYTTIEAAWEMGGPHEAACHKTCIIVCTTPWFDDAHSMGHDHQHDRLC
jgi:hypothetical protein